MNWPFGRLQMFGYDVVVADVPALFDLYGKPSEKAAAGLYNCMTDEELMALPVGHLVRQNALLLYWTTGWAIATGRAQAVIRAWGAEPVTEIVWIKVTKNGKPRMGTGYRVRTLHEPIILAKWGNPKHDAFPSSFTGIARRHSEKPIEAYEIFRRKTPGAVRCDLFSAGIERPGFFGWGEDHRLRISKEGDDDLGSRHERERAQRPSLFGEEV